MKLFQGMSSGLGGSAADMQAAADQWTKAAASISDPQIKDAATKISQYLKQNADYKTNPSSAPQPDSNAFNTATNEMGKCVGQK